MRSEEYYRLTEYIQEILIFWKQLLSFEFKTRQSKHYKPGTCLISIRNAASAFVIGNENSPCLRCRIHCAWAWHCNADRQVQHISDTSLTKTKNAGVLRVNFSSPFFHLFSRSSSIKKCCLLKETGVFITITICQRHTAGSKCTNHRQFIVSRRFTWLL